MDVFYTIPIIVLQSSSGKEIGLWLPVKYQIPHKYAAK